eukprot:g6954.t1
MATLVNDSAPDAEVVEATLVEGAFYSSIDSCEFHLLAVNSEGAVDYGRSGKFEVQFKPSPKTKYTMVAAGTQANYLLKDDGVIVRAVGNMGNMGIDCEISPPEKVKYTQVSSGYSASYFLRDDGKVDRTTGSGKIQLTMESPTKAKYVQIVAGHVKSFFLRDDGDIDFSSGHGKIDGTIACKDDGVKYINMTSLSMGVTTDTADTNPHQIYFIRSDGLADKFRPHIFGKSGAELLGTVKCNNTTDVDVKYTSGSTCSAATYLLRSDGAVDRITTGTTVASTMNPPPNQRYIAVNAGNSASYLLRSDGKIDRTKGSGVVASTMEAPEELKAA